MVSDCDSYSHELILTPLTQLDSMEDTGTSSQVSSPLPTTSLLFHVSVKQTGT